MSGCSYNSFRSLAKFLALAACFLSFCSMLRSQVVLSNVRASQRPQTRLVDILYDLSHPLGDVDVALEISDDGGQTYLVHAMALSGDLGPGISPGQNKHIVWNAGLDRPGRFSPEMRFRVCATDGVPAGISFDTDSIEFFTRSVASGDPISAAARIRLDLFVKESKRLGFWNAMVFVPCRKGFGALNTLGGSPKRTNAKFVVQGVADVSNVGLKFSPGVGNQNGVSTPFNVGQADEPIFIGVLGYVENGQDQSPGASWLRTSQGGALNLLGQYFHSAGYLPGFSTAGSASGEFYVVNEDFITVKKPNFVGAQYDGGGTLRCVLGARYFEITSATATTGHPVGPVYFMQPSLPNDSVVVQGCLMLYGQVNPLPMKSLAGLVEGAFLNDIAGKYVHVHLAGQSNANYEILGALQRLHWKAFDTPLFQSSASWYPGQPISYWVGSDPQNPTRTAAYLAARDAWLSARPAHVETEWDAPYFWVQGETDTDASLPDVYAGQLRNLVAFLRQDLRSDLQMAVGLIDFSIAYRTAPDQGNFYLNFVGGSAASALGSYVISPITGLQNSDAIYSWTKGDWRITKDGGVNANQWRIHSNGATYFLGEGDELHPVLVTNWTPMNGATGAPLVQQSRTGNTEKIRKIQREFVSQDARAFVVDSRGCERGLDGGGTDFVHMTSLGYQQFALRFSQAFKLHR